jgi:hypothetical protein
MEKNILDDYLIKYHEYRKFKNKYIRLKYNIQRNISSTSINKPYLIVLELNEILGSFYTNFDELYQYMYYLFFDDKNNYTTEEKNKINTLFKSILILFIRPDLNEFLYDIKLIKNSNPNNKVIIITEDYNSSYTNKIILGIEQICDCENLFDRIYTRLDMNKLGMDERKRELTIIENDLLNDFKFGMIIIFDITPNNMYYNNNLAYYCVNNVKIPIITPYIIFLNYNTIACIYNKINVIFSEIKNTTNKKIKDNETYMNDYLKLFYDIKNYKPNILSKKYKNKINHFHILMHNFILLQNYANVIDSLETLGFVSNYKNDLVNSLKLFHQ